MHSEPHPFARQSFGDFIIEDWFDRLAHKSWRFCGGLGVIKYATRVVLGLPPDDEVVYGHVKGLGLLRHQYEIDYELGNPIPPRFIPIVKMLCEGMSTESARIQQQLEAHEQNKKDAKKNFKRIMASIRK